MPRSAGSGRRADLREVAGPDALNIALGGADNDFAEGPSFTDVSKSVGNFLEGEGAVDVDP